jgi:hypothetical protein
LIRVNSVGSERAASVRVVPAKKETERFGGPGHCERWYTKDAAGVNGKPLPGDYNRQPGLTTGLADRTTWQPTGA